MECERIQEHLDAYVDGELEPTPAIEVDRHLDDCALCRSELVVTRLIKQGVRQHAVRTQAPASLRLLVQQTLDEDSGADSGRRVSSGVGFGALALAASVMLLVGVSYTSPVRSPGSGGGETPPIMPIVQQVVDTHVRQLPTEFRAERPERAARWFRGKLGFRLHPVGFSEPRVHFMGGRISNVGEQRAAQLYYRVGDDPMTVLAFEASERLREALRREQAGEGGVQRVRIGDRVVTYHNVHDYTVPMIEHNGIVYAFTGDLDRRNLLRLVASARLP